MAEQEVKQETKVESKQPDKKAVKPIIYGSLKSRADFTIPIKHNGQSIFLAPYGIAKKLVKDKIEFDQQFARYLTFIKD